MSENVQESGQKPARRIVVLLHTKGRFAGLRQITGSTDDLLPGQPIPQTTGEFTICPDTRLGIASLIKTTTRYLLYREN